MLGPKFKTVLLWSTPLSAAAWPRRRWSRGGHGAGAGRRRPAGALLQHPQVRFPWIRRRGSGSRLRRSRPTRTPRRPPHRHPAHGRTAESRVHRIRADGRDHQRVEPRAEGGLQGPADASRPAGRGKRASGCGREAISSRSPFARCVARGGSCREQPPSVLGAKERLTREGACGAKRGAPFAPPAEALYISR